MKSVKLDQWIKATDFSTNQVVAVGGNKNITRVQILTLEPQQNFSSPIKFSVIWNELLKAYSENYDLYYLLFNKLIDYTGSPADSLLISFKTSSPALFSFQVYHHQGIKVEQISLNIRDPEPFDPGDLDDNSAGGILQNLPQIANINNRIINGLNAFFRSHKHSKPVIIEQKSWGPGILRFMVSNVHGEVTPNLHEKIIVNIFIQPADENRINVSYLFTVFYSGGVFRAPTDSDDYKDAINSYKKHVALYGIKLKQQLRSLLTSK